MLSTQAISNYFRSYREYQYKRYDIVYVYMYFN